MTLLHKKSHSSNNELPSPTHGRIIALGTSQKRRERLLWTALGSVCFILVILLGTMSWLFYNGTILIAPKRQYVLFTNLIPAAVTQATQLPPTDSSKQPHTPKDTKANVPIVPATMAPTPANGKFEDIVLPAEKTTSLAESSTKTTPPLEVIHKASSPQKLAIVPTSSPLAAELIRKEAPHSHVSAAKAPDKAKHHVRLKIPSKYELPKDTLKSRPSNPALEQANTLLQQGEYADALVVYDRILDQKPHDYDALLGKASALQHTEQYEAAINIDRILIKINPGNEEVRANLTTNLKMLNTH